MDVGYSLGMSVAFFAATYLQNTPLAFLSPYFDQIIALLVMIFMLPETVRMLLNTCRELFLFSPDQETVDRIKELFRGGFVRLPVHPRVLRHLPHRPPTVDRRLLPERERLHFGQGRAGGYRPAQQADRREFPDAACELILDNHPSEILRTDPEGQMA